MTINRGNLISIIVPIYNLNGFLSPCLNSILASTYQDFELILVDDGSSDSSGDICDEYAVRDSRVKVYHQENAGVSAARNLGIRVSKGEYVTFVDGDDLIHPTMLEVLYDAIVGDDYDFSMVFHRRIGIEEAGGFLNTEPLEAKKARVLSRNDFMQRMYNTAVCVQYVGPCQKLFKRAFIDGIFFKAIAAEDVEWMTRLCLRMNNGVLIEQPFYFYVNRSNSLSHSHEGVNQVVVDRLLTHLLCYKEIPDNETRYQSMCLEDLYRRMLYTRHAARNTRYEQAVKEKISVIHKETISKYLHSDIPVATKMKTVACYHCPWLYRFVISLSELIAKCRNK